MTTAADVIRGHPLIPAEGVLSSWPDLYSTESAAPADKMIHAHFFIGACDWWLAELDQESRRLAFGFVNLGDSQCAEWGYFDLKELAGIAVTHPSGLLLAIERDLHWTPRLFGQIREAQR